MARQVVAVAGVEVCCDDALLRSVAVQPDWRRHGLGHELVRRIVSHAEERGFRALYLLTMTAEHHVPLSVSSASSARPPAGDRRYLGIQIRVSRERRGDEASRHGRRPLGIWRPCASHSFRTSTQTCRRWMRCSPSIARRGDVDAVFHLGDLVGYTPAERCPALARCAHRRDLRQLRFDRRDGLQRLRMSLRGPATGSAVPCELRVNTGTCIARDEDPSWAATVPSRPASAWWARRRTHHHARPRDAGQQRHVLDGGWIGLLLSQDGGGRGRRCRWYCWRRRTHVRCVARHRGHSFPQHRERWSAQGWRLARRLRARCRRRRERNPG